MFIKIIMKKEKNNGRYIRKAYILSDKKYLLFYSDIIYLFSLSSLNNKLLELEKKGVTSWKLIQFNNYQPILYFVFALLLGIVGVILLLELYFKLRYYNNLDDIIYYIIMAILLIIFIILIFYFIAIPILKIIFTVCITGLTLLYISSNG